MRVLKVRGVGYASKETDLIVIQLKIKVDNYNYEDAMNELNYRTEVLKNDLVQIGFSRDDIKTTNFNVETKYKYKDDQTIFLGYKAEHDLKLEFDYNRTVLNNVLRILSTSKSNPEFRVFFEVKDKNSFKNEAIEDAVRNAFQLGKIIANASGVKLGKIININYDLQNIVYRSKVMLENMMVSEQVSNIDIVPEELLITEQISIEFEIEN